MVKEKQTYMAYSTHLYLHVYVYVCVYACVYVYVYVYAYFHVWIQRKSLCYVYLRRIDR